MSGEVADTGRPGDPSPMPPDAGRPRDPDVDDRIVAAARAILDAEGPKALSVTRVAKAADVSRPTVYRRYADADDLLRGVLFAELDAVLAANRQTIAAMEPVGPVVDELVQMALQSMRFYAENPERSRALLSASMLAEPRWQARWDTLNAEVAGIALRVVQGGVDRGELPPDTDLFLCVQSYLLAFLGVLLAALNGAYGPDPAHWAEALHRILDLHFEGLHLRARMLAQGVELD